jgi:hypothetical protein
MKNINHLVDRFLSWPLPKSVCADPCASNPDYPGRSGTNLLNAEQARQMLEHVLGPDVVHVLSAGPITADISQWSDSDKSALVALFSVHKAPQRGGLV